MSLSVLYHALGIYGYHHLKTESHGGTIYLYMVRAKNRGGFCRSWKVIGKGYCWRRLRTLPIGRKPVFALVRMRRFYCENCRWIRYEDLIITDRRKVVSLKAPDISCLKDKKNYPYQLRRSFCNS
ncbi:MAG: hypothetical protein WA915_16450 [Candidatus Aminicenantaceae bacterium]